MPLAQTFGWTPLQIAELTIPLMLRIAEELNRAASDAPRTASRGARSGGDRIDLTKMTASAAAAELRGYGFG